MTSVCTSQMNAKTLLSLFPMPDGSETRSANSATGTDPKDWQFDPSFSTNRNAFTVTAKVLI